MYNRHMFTPHDIEVKFAIEDGMAYMDSIFANESEGALAQIEQVREIIESLPAIEADFVELYYFKKLKQTDIAALFNVSQPTVCYRLQRATARIQFLLQLPKVEDSELLEDMEVLLTDPVDVQIMALMRETMCQSEVAKKLGVTQGLVRHRFFRAIKYMKDFVLAVHLESELPVLKPDNISKKTKEGSEYLKALALVDYWKNINLPSYFWTDEYRDRFILYAALFEFLAVNLNIMRELQKTHAPPEVLPDDYIS